MILGVPGWGVGEDSSYGNLELDLVRRCSKGYWSRGAEVGLLECI